MHEFTLIREHGPEPTPLSDDVLTKARADLLTEINAPSRPVRLGRRAIFAAAAVAIVVTGVVVTSGTDKPNPPAVYPTPVLVEFAMPALPPELNPIPAGVTAPSFTAEPGWLAAIYRAPNDASGEMSSINVTAFANRPSSDGTQTTHAGKPAVLEKVDQKDPVVRVVALSWERAPGQWIRLSGIGRFADEGTVRALADTLIDTDKRLSLDIKIAPAGWELYAFKGAAPDGAGAVTSLRDPRHPDRTIQVSTMLALLPDYGRAVEGGPRDTVPVSVNGRPGDLVQIPGKQWMLQAPLPDGRAFQLQVPADFTPQQVIELAEGVS
jgi:hypothetical protein